MTKTSGMGDRLLISGYDLSGDIQQLGTIGCPRATLETTGIDKDAFERIYGLRDGVIEATTYFNPSATRVHPVLSVLPTTDVHLMYCRGAILGNPAACLVAKQINYDGLRGNDGAFTFSVQAQGNAYGLEWGELHTAGFITDASASNGSEVDSGGATAFGLQAYLQVVSIGSGTATVKIQESSTTGGAPDTWADVVGGAFTAVTAQTTERIETGRALAVEQFLRVITTGTFTNLVYAVSVVRNQAEVVF